MVVRICWNNGRGTAVSAVWKITDRLSQTILALVSNRPSCGTVNDTAPAKRLCSTVGPRTAPRAPFHRSRDRARYRYYEGSRSGPAVTACQHYFENCSFSRDVMRQSSRTVLRQRSNGVRSCLRG